MLLNRNPLRKFAITMCCVALGLTSFKKPGDNEKKAIAAEMKKSMVDKLLKPWYPAAIDTLDGGFLSSFSYNFKPVGNQDKMIVTQSRHVWSNAKAAEEFPNVPYYKYGAKHGFEFLRDVMWDKEYGGFYTYVDRKGNFAPKEAYGNSFAIYGLSAYYQVSGDTSALNLAVKGFMWLEKHSHDPIYKGYFQHMERDGTPIKRTANTPTTAETGYKDQNTSIHLMEAFNELYTVWPNALVKARLNEMLYLIRDTLVTPKGYLNLFFQSDWTPVSYRDSSLDVMMKHKELNHVSFGHDIETAYLMLEASHTLGIENDTTTLRIGKKMLDHALDNGYDNSVGGFYDEGYYYKNKPGITILEDTKNWWAQAEGMNTLLIMDKYYPNDSHQYLKKFKQMWTYTKTYLIDSVNGDWYQGGIDKQPQYKMALKGQIWKGTYHNFRALMNCIQSLEPDITPPASPGNLKIQRANNSKILKWNGVKNDDKFVGYNVYLDGKRIWYTPLRSFIIPADMIGKSFKVTAVDIHGNESKSSKPVAL